MRGCENYNLIVLIRFFETLDCIRTNIDTSLYCITIRESNIYDLITWIILNIIDTMYQCFIKIKYDGLLNIVIFERRKLHSSRFNVILISRWQSFDILKRLQCLYQMISVKFRTLEVLNLICSSTLDFIFILIFLVIAILIMMILVLIQVILIIIIIGIHTLYGLNLLLYLEVLLCCHR